jgi:tetratricopeptide (TPR) repeat protein
VVAFFIIARWRLPLVIPLLLFAAAGLVALFRWARSHQWKSLAAGATAAVALALIIYPGRGPFIFPADHGELGYILANRGDYPGAASELTLAVAGSPQDGRLHRDLGILLDRTGRPDKARMVLEQAVLLLPNDPVVHRFLGRLLLGPGGDTSRARAHLALALALDPHGPGAGEVRVLLEKLDRGAQEP